MVQTEFAQRVVATAEQDENILGIAAGGSWITNELDEFSDLDLVVVTAQKITADTMQMVHFAKRVDNFLSGFTGEHVGEPRLLICLYDNPLLHVDYKFVTLEEFKVRIETPVILLDKTGALHNALEDSKAVFPYPDYQWIEDRFWIWVHYALLKIGRGEYLETVDFFSDLRRSVLGPLLHIKNGHLPRGVRKVETALNATDLSHLLHTLPEYNRSSLLESLHHAVQLYRTLRTALFSENITFQKATEERVMLYFKTLEDNNKTS